MSKDKESICVTVRVRPLSSKELDEDSRICLRVQQALNLISMNGPEKEAKDFYFDSVCDKISQNQVFERVGKRSTIYCMEGYNCTIFAYGQTGAGKTYTMMGVNPESKDYHQQRGLIPRTLQHLFECIQKQITQSGVDYIIKCSFVQIYNQQIIDLLGAPNSILNIREDLKKGVYIQGVAEEIISQSQEAMEILRKGSKGRHVGSTFYNQTSSRSHSVFTMQIESQQLCNGIKSTKSRHFHFIDLAGSERTKKSMGDRLKQGCSINKSLHVLSMVISSLAQVSEGKSRHVNYRDSKLTFLLKDSLGGNSKTHLIANISPSWISSLETKSTLMFARKVKLIKVNKVSINEDASGNLQSLKAEIRRLRSQNLVLRNGNVGFPLQISVQASQNVVPTTTNNSKMVTVLQQYVDEQLEKQTKMQLQISKLQNRNQHLQRGIKHFSENEKQLRMVLAIYEDKIKKLKAAESLLYHKLNEISESQKIEQIKQYYMTERQILLEQIEKFKQLSTSSTIVKHLLRELKAIKENPENTKDEQGLISVLTKNNQFLQEIKNSIAQLEPQMQQGKASKAVMKENQEIKAQMLQLSQRVEKYALQVAESKDKVEETQNLLNEAISSQISLQKKLENQQTIHQTYVEQNKQRIEHLEKKLAAAEQNIRSLVSDKNSLQLSISQYQLQISQIKGQFSRLKEKKQFEQLNFQQKLQALTTQNLKLEETLKKRGEEVQKYKNESLNMKNESERINKQTQQILAEASSRIQQLQQLVSKVQGQKSEMRVKFDKLNTQFEDSSKSMSKQHEKLISKNNELNQEVRSYQQQILRYQQEVLGLKEKVEKNMRNHEQEKMKWEQNHNELMRVINEKRQNDSETQTRLTESKLEVITLNEKLAQITIQHKQALQNLKNLQVKSSGRLSELDQQLLDRTRQLQQTRNEIEEGKRRIQVLTESQHSFKRQFKVLEQQIVYKDEQKNKAHEEVEKIKKKQKEARIQINEIKNEMYALKTNYEIEIQSLKEGLRLKQDQISLIENENTNLKETHEKSISELQKKTQAQLEIFKQNQGSIKRAMQAHLANKQKKLSQLKTSYESTEQQLKIKCQQLHEIENNCQLLRNQLNNYEIQLRELQKQRQGLKEDLLKNQEVISVLESEHLRVLEDMENNFNQSLDVKNAEIQTLRRKTEQYELSLQAAQSIQAQNNKLKSQLINKQQLQEQLQNSLTHHIHQLHHLQQTTSQSSTTITNLQHILKQKQAQISELTNTIQQIQNNAHIQILDKQSEINKLYTLLEQNQRQLENVKIVHDGVVREKEEKIQGYLRVVEDRDRVIGDVGGEVQGVRRENQGLRGRVVKLEEELSDVLKSKQHIQQVLNQKIKIQEELTNFIQCPMPEGTSPQNLRSKIEEVVSNLSDRNKILEGAVQKTTLINKSISQQNSRFIEIIKQLEMQLQTRSRQSSGQMQISRKRLEQEEVNNARLTQEIRSVMDKNVSLQRNINQLSILLERKSLEIKNLENHLSLAQRKAESEESMLNERLAKVHEQSTKEAERLNELYQASKQKAQLLKVQIEKQVEGEEQIRRAFQMRIQQLEGQNKAKCDLLDKIETEMNIQKQRSEQLQKFIDEQGYKISHLQQQKDRAFEELQEIKQESEKRLKQSEKRCQLGAAQMNSLRQQIKLIQDEASVWKQRMENLENQIRLSNERAQKFRMQYMKEKQSNKEFKILLENAQCQIDSFKNQAMDKDKLYHQLLEKVSKNDIERKGLMNQQDKKFSELLQKSRIQVSQMRKKYEDQLKINNLLKQELEKKDIDVSVVKQRSEQYCKKQQQLMDSIRSDYSKVENELKSVQNILSQNKKALKKVTLKNQELQQQLLKMNKQCASLESQNEELKKETLKTGMDQRQMGYLNKLKQENTQLKRELQRVSQEVIAVNQQKLRLKSQLRQGKDLDISNLELSKKISEVKYLQKIIDDSINVLGIRDYKKSVGQSLKMGIMELQRQLSKSKSQLSQLNDEMCLKNQRLQILENQKLKIGMSKEEEDTLTKMRNKINKTSSTFESIRQSKEDDKLILQMKDPNKSNLWGINRP